MSCLFGYWGRFEPGLLDRMAGLLKHRCRRGWHGQSLRTEDGRIAEMGHGLGPLSQGPQLLSDPEGDALFGYAGVLFNEAAVSKTGQARSLLSALRRDPGGLAELEGAFTGALALSRELRLVRDPAGIKVIYWTRHKDRLLFAGEIKALFADPQVERRMRIGALPEYLTFSFIPGENTMFEGIYELQPGHILTYQGDAVAVDRHFRFETLEGKNGRPDRFYIDRVKTALSRSVAECCENRAEPPGVFLSGGIDSSAVLAQTARCRPDQRIKTFSVHFGEKYPNENDFISMMVERYKTDHTWLEIRPKKFLSRLPEIIWALDDPIGDPITAPNYLLAEAASQRTDTILNGEGGDPCFGGPKNIPMMLADIYGPHPGDPTPEWLEHNYLLSYRRCFADLDRILSPEVTAASGGDAALTAILSPFFEAEQQCPRSFLNRLMAINIRLKGANMILVKVEKMTAANGIIALAPLFSRRIIETCMACPPRLKLDGNIEKGILKRAVAGMVPQPIIERPKSGMRVPVRFWLKGEMRRYAKRKLSKRNLKRLGYFNEDYVAQLLDYDYREIRSSRFGMKLWMLITFILWHEKMIEGK